MNNKMLKAIIVTFIASVILYGIEVFFNSNPNFFNEDDRPPVKVEEKSDRIFFPMKEANIRKKIIKDTNELYQDVILGYNFKENDVVYIYVNQHIWNNVSISERKNILRNIFDIFKNNIGEEKAYIIDFQIKEVMKNE